MLIILRPLIYQNQKYSVVILRKQLITTPKNICDYKYLCKQQNWRIFTKKDNISICFSTPKGKGNWDWDSMWKRE